MTRSHHFVLTLGSNTDAEAHIAFVREELLTFPHCSLRFSTPRLSAPVEFALSSALFTDVVVVGDTHEELTTFADRLKDLERRAGRTPEQRATTPEQIPIDIDLISWDDLILKPRDLSRPYLHLGLRELDEVLPPYPITHISPTIIPREMTSLEELYTLYLQHPTVSTDTRQLPEGCMFFALRGATFDGNKFALQALEAGAAYAVVDDPCIATQSDRLLLVPDVLQALQQLAHHHRKTLGLPVIAITGTNGKTTTKELTAAVLSEGYRLLYTEGNLNNHIGVPLTLLRLRSEHQLALIEMGASKPGDIAELCAIAEPDYGLITNIGEAHLEGFGSLEGVRKTKGELYDSVRSRGGILFVHADDSTLMEMSQGAEKIITYAEHVPALVEGEVCPQGEELFLHFRWIAPALPFPQQEVRTHLVGDYNLSNALAAIAIGLFFRLPVVLINEALSSYVPSNSRSQLILSPRGNRIIADAYNANPSSMQTAIHNFLHIPPMGSPRTLILGDMNELGQESDHAHLKLWEELQQYGTHQPLRVILCGPKWKAIRRGEGEVFPSVGELKGYLQEHPLTETLILIKGSNSIHLSELLPLL